jgi:hypothetical protein
MSGQEQDALGHAPLAPFNLAVLTRSRASVIPAKLWGLC